MVDRGSAWSASWSRRCRWARRRSAARWSRPASTRPTSGCSRCARCTGYVTPGLDILLARDLGMAAGTQRLFIGHMGCYAALPGLGAAADFVTARGRPALVLCCELTEPARAAGDPGPAADHRALAVLRRGGGGGAAARPRRRAARARGDASCTDTTTADHMTWDVTDLGFRMGLSPKVPDALAAARGAA